MNSPHRKRTCLLAVALLTGLGLTATALPAQAAAPAPGTSTGTSTIALPADPGPDTKALAEALQGLPDANATAALVRVGGTGRDWHGSAGVRDLHTQAPAREEARFRAGSTTKVVTAALVLQLAAEGRVDLDAPVQRYLPDLLTPAFDPISVRQLLTFTSGLRPGASLGPEDAEGYENRFRTLTPEEVVAESVRQGPDAAPGERQRYGNIEYTVLGMLIEKVSGDAYEHQALVRIFRPAGMRHTSFPDGPDPRIHGPHHRGYQLLADGRLVDATEWNMSDRWAVGNMISTTGDLERFLYALFRGRLVPKPQLKEMFTVPEVRTGEASMSAGLQRYPLPDKRVVWLKTGSRPGYSTGIAATEDLTRTLVYSVNSTDAKGEQVNPVVGRLQAAAFSR
ncbi:beta-lactamase family protein [Streptomyces sp. TRM66268-LWL]|uniref:Beta-lactamase family protein n=1 Tax=Streptomyces polyasparticus TaxID=2767826 RepID=A0ABR7S9S5_9ACTN|nr:serine hydrolase domain-containing protein [Streptomyces polyasparticus]MBC9711707.1 beta-lactamase family protein [Streptomyces polyasparticus]